MEKKEEEEKEKPLLRKQQQQKEETTTTPDPPCLNTFDVGQKHKPLQEIYWIHVTRKEPTTIAEMARFHHARRPYTESPAPFTTKQSSPSVGRSYEPKPFDADA